MIIEVSLKGDKYYKNYLNFLWENKYIDFYLNSPILTLMMV